MALPNVQVTLTNNNLGLQAPSQNGVSVVLVAAPAAPAAGYGTPFLVAGMADVETAFADPANAPVVAAFAKGYYAEAPEGTRCYVLAMAPTTTLETLLAPANAEKALNAAAGEARLLAAIKFPGELYNPTISGGFDGDVHAAVTAAQTLAANWNAKNKGFRFFIEGFGFTNATAATDYSTHNKRNGAIIVGSVANSTAIATLLALGRAARVQPQENIGKVKTGSLNIAPADPVQIGSTPAELVPLSELNTLYNKRYIFPVRNEVASGYVWNDDNTLTSVTDDYNNIAYGRIIDNAQRIAYREFYEELKDDVNVEPNGRLAAVVEKALETKIENAIDRDMRTQLNVINGRAAVQCLVNPDATEFAALYAKNNISNPNLNIIQNNTVYIFLFLQPKGSVKFINIYLGLTAELTNA